MKLLLLRFALGLSLVLLAGAGGMWCRSRLAKFSDEVWRFDRDYASGLPVARAIDGASSTRSDLVPELVPIKHLFIRLIRLERTAIVRDGFQMYVFNLADHRSPQPHLKRRAARHSKDR